jgi:hypothetical protein
MHRPIETDRTYRLQHEDQYSLFWVMSVSEDTIKLKDLKTDKIKEISTHWFQENLDSGKVTVSS